MILTKPAIAMGSKWVVLFRRLAKVNLGISSKLMKQMFQAVTIPKMTYTVDIWYTPVTLPTGAKKRIGSVAVLREINKIQRIVAIVITGGGNRHSRGARGTAAN